MNKYILLLGIAGVALGSYHAYAGNSATMTVTATIAHDVSLSVTQDLDLGTITVNPAATEESSCSYTETGVVTCNQGDAFVSASNATVGAFTANIANKTACNTASNSCGGLNLGNNGTVDNIFGGSGADNSCQFYIKYTGSSNIFKVYPWDCMIEEGGISSVTSGSHSGTLTINYSAGG
ncbi:MAG: hypothetical protein IJ689_06025 [Alphaproteobacteria bacterium]|nr:hypothetical protein [Alphaproteobacteria bacterium]